VRDTAWLDYELARTGLEDLVAELDADAARQDVEVFVLVVVGVEVRPGRAAESDVRRG
jgi:hypothetical protein